MIANKNCTAIDAPILTNMSCPDPGIVIMSGLMRFVKTRPQLLWIYAAGFSAAP